MNAADFRFPTYSRAERRADLCIHALGILGGVAGTAILLTVGLRDAPANVAAGLIVYTIGLLAMLTFSACYHAVTHPRRKQILRRFDHGAIYVMIAGTYTPFALAKIDGALGTGLLAFVWTLAAAGVAIKIFRPQASQAFSLTLYFVMGWCVIIAIEPLFATLGPTSTGLLLAGGIAYTIGVVFHLWRGLPFHNAIWHGCVVTGAALHYVVILGSVALLQA